MSLNNFYVYFLIDPRTGIPFYVGKGCGNRMFCHEKFVINGRVPNNNFLLKNRIKELLNLKLPIVYEKVYENLDSNQAERIEALYIQCIGRIQTGKGTLLNLTEGGEGTNHLTEETKRKISIALTGRTFSDKHRKHLSIQMLNRPRSFFTRIANSQRGRKHTKETKEKISKNKLQYYKNSENKEFIVSKIRENLKNPEVRKKISNSVKRLYDNEEYRKAHSEKMKKISAGSKHWKFIDPNDNVVEIFNLLSYCKLNGLHYECMKRVGRGIRKSYKKWRKYENAGN